MCKQGVGGKKCTPMSKQPMKSAILSILTVLSWTFVPATRTDCFCPNDPNAEAENANVICYVIMKFMIRKL